MVTDADRAFDEFTRKLAYLPGRKEIWHAAVAWATARERERRIDDAKNGAFPGFVNYGHDLPDTSDLDCPHCGGSGHKDDVRPLSPTAVDDKETADIGSNDPRQNLGSLAQYRISDIETGRPESVDTHGVEGDPIPRAAQPEPPADLAELARERFGSHPSSPLPAAVAALPLNTQRNGRPVRRGLRKSRPPGPLSSGA